MEEKLYLIKFALFEAPFTCENEGVNGDPVVLVLLVGVGALEPEAGQQGPEEVGDEPDDAESSTPAKVA